MFVCVCVCVCIHTHLRYIYVNIDGNITINTHTHTHKHTNSQATHHVQRIMDKGTKNLAPVRYTPTTLTLTFKVEIIRRIKAQRVCVWGGGVCVFVAIRKKQKSYIYV
jgi:hypothetical protein